MSKKRPEMLPFQNYYSLASNSSRSWTSTDIINGGGGSTTMSNSTATEKKSISASKSHSEAEKRRRERINGHLQTLRTLLPNTIKSDKASLLAEVVHQVRELRKTASDVADKEDDEHWRFPGETDELRISYCDSDNEESSSSRIKVTLSCEDRVELVKDLSQAVKTVRGRVVKAEMSTIGGRTKSELVIEGRGGGGVGKEEYLGMLKRALKSAVERHGVSGNSQVLFGSKRQRLSHQLYHSQS